jgi:hypothetical protein
MHLVASSDAQGIYSNPDPLGDVTIADEGLQNFGLCSALRALEKERIFIVPHLLGHGASVFPVSSEGPPHSVAFYNTQGDVEDLTNALKLLRQST